MSEAIGRGVIELTADATGLNAAISEARKRIGDLGGTSEQTNKRSAASIDRYVRSLETAAAVQGKSAREAELYKLALRGASDAQLAAANSALKMTEAVRRTGPSLAQTSAAMRTLPAQFTDIATQLQGGANPLTILLQQGGQIKDSFGGVGPALTALGGFITPLAVGVGSLAAATAGLGFVFFKASQDAAELQKNLAKTGNAAGLTADLYDSMAASIAASVRITSGAAREALQATAATGDVGPRLVREMATAVALTAQVTGESAAKIVGDFAKMSDGVAKWAAEQNRSLNFITAAEYERVRALEESGRKTEAQAIVLQAYNERMQSAAATTGFWSERVRFLKSDLDSLGEAIRRAFAPNLGDQIAALDARIEARRASLAGRFGVGEDRVAGALQSQRNALVAANESSSVAAVMNAASVATQKAGIAASDYLDKLNKQSKGASQLATALAELKRQQQAFRASGGVLSASDAAAQEREVRRANAPPRDAGVDKARREAEQAAKDATQANERLKESIAGYLSEQQAEISNAGPLDAVRRQHIAQLKAIEQAGKSREKGGNGLSEAEVNARRVEANAARVVAEQNAAQQAAKRGAEELASARTREEAAARAETAQIRDGNRAVEEQIALMGASLQTQAAIERARLQSIITAKEMRLAEIALFGDGIATESLREQIRLLKERNDLIAKSAADQADPTKGAIRAFQRYQEEAANLGQQVKDSITRSLQGAEDALVDFALTGKLNFKSLASSIIADIARIQAKQAISSAISAGGGFLKGLFGGGGSGGGIISSILGAITPRAEGGPVNAGQPYIVGEHRPELFVPSRSGTILPSVPSGGASGPVTIINQTTGRIDSAQETRLPNGERAIIIREAVIAARRDRAGALSDPNSSDSRALRRNFDVARTR